jgi:hypothetical protein
MVEGCLQALKDLDSQVLDDRILQERLDRIYSGPIATWWSGQVSKAIANFERDVLGSWRAFASSEDIRDMFDRMFDGAEVLPEALELEFRNLIEEHPFEAPSLMVPVSLRQWHMLKAQNRLRLSDVGGRKIGIAGAPYDAANGLQLQASHESV